MTPEAIKQAKGIIAAATPGPWDYRVNEFSNTARARFIWSEYGFIGEMFSPFKSAEIDAQFIAAARTGWPEALDEVEKLRKFIVDRKFIVNERDHEIEKKQFLELINRQAQDIEYLGECNIRLKQEREKLRAVTDAAREHMKYGLAFGKLEKALKALDEK